MTWLDLIPVAAFIYALLGGVWLLGTSSNRWPTWLIVTWVCAVASLIAWAGLGCTGSWQECTR